MADIYRDSRGRFTRERAATFKRSDGKNFIRLFGKWTELQPVTAESFWARMQLAAAAQNRAAALDNFW